VRTRRPTDLRKLSEWIRLQRQVESLKKEDTQDAQDAEDPGKQR